MKRITLFIITILAGCDNTGRQNEVVTRHDTAKISIESTKVIHRKNLAIQVPAAKKYSNARFKEVMVEKTGDHEFLVQGLGQIFEAGFNWIVEDGHEELKKGFQMTDAGAPEWGKFKFTINAQKKRPNSTLHLILFEASAKDGSRQHELPVLLY